MHEYHYIRYHFLRRSDCTYISFISPGPNGGKPEGQISAGILGGENRNFLRNNLTDFRWVSPCDIQISDGYPASGYRGFHSGIHATSSTPTCRRIIRFKPDLAGYYCLYPKTYFCRWRFLTVFGGFWRFLMVVGGFWRFLTQICELTRETRNFRDDKGCNLIPNRIKKISAP